LLSNIEFQVPNIELGTIMQMPINLKRTLEALDERGSLKDAIQCGAELSLKSQLKMRGLYDYIDSCRLTLDEIQRDLSLGQSGPEVLMNLQSASEKLERFCVEADSWGFNALFEIALGLKMLLLNLGNRSQSNGFQELLQRGVSMLSALLDQCERDFCWRLAIADMLESFDQAGRR
jgi:hypothetical protein